MRVVLLGPLQVYDGAEQVAIGGARVRALLARLALDAGRSVPVGSLVDGLWGEDLPADASNALQALVSRLRRALRGTAAVELAAGGYRLAVRPADVDVHRFEELAARGRRELAADRPRQAASALGEALGLWEGAALEDFAEVPFAGAVKARLEELRGETVEAWCEAELRMGRHVEVLARLDAVRAEHPLRERSAALRMRALHAAGRTADALAEYERMREGLAEELGVDPSAELRETHLSVLRGQIAVPTARPEPVPGSLPGRLTSFVGRDEEMGLLAELLATSRLVTIVGAGGVGKTRLAVEAVAGHEVYRRGRGWLVPLGEVSTPNRLAEAVLGVLGSGDRRPWDGRPRAPRPVDRVVELLDSGEALLVLDNCEHLVDDVAGFAHHLLERLPRLTILATSREPLAITGEALCQLSPLGVPEDPEHAARTPAVRLFCDRAAAVRPGFTLDPAAVAPVAHICRRLDGLPLALELAAARLRSMSVQQIAQRLDDRFRLLTSGDRGALPRRRTLLAVVEWSWDLLTDPERVLARRLSVFPAGASGTTIEAVCSDGTLPPRDVIYVLGSLVEKSLVEMTGGGTRYRMLETVRAYASERLGDAGEREDLAARFVRHLLAVAEEHEPLLRSREQLRALAVFDAEYDNLVVALRAAVDGGDADTAARLLGALFWYWNSRFDARSDALTAEVLDMGAVLPDRARAAITAVRLLAGNSGSLPDRTTARSAIEECVRTRAMEHHPMLVAVTLPAAYLSGLDELAEHQMRAARSSPDLWTRAFASWVEAFVHTDRGAWDRGRRACEAALRGFEEVGERGGLALTLSHLARVHSVQGEHTEAVAAAQRCVSLGSELGVEQETWYRVRLATERARGGDMAGAWRDAEEAGRRAEGRRLAEIEVLLCRADLHRRSGEPDAADQTLGRLEGIARELPLPADAIGCRVAPARTANLLAAGRRAEARASLAEAVAAAFTVRDVALAAQLLARLLWQEGDPAGAATALGMSRAVRGAFDHGDPEVGELVAALTARLGAPGYDQAYRGGAELTRDQALGRLTAEGGRPAR